MKSIFISSAPGALDDYRRAVEDACYRQGLRVVTTAYDVCAGPSELQRSLQRVDGCDAFVILIAHRVGPKVAAAVDDVVVEREYTRALATGMPIHAFVVDPSHRWPADDMDEDSERDRLRSFVSRVQADVAPKTFGGLQQFREDIYKLLAEYRTDVADGERAIESVRAPALYANPPYVATQPFTGRAEGLRMLDTWAKSNYPMLVLEAIGGNGKSALTWEWTNARATGVVSGLAGRFWWSFYEGSNSMAAFVAAATGYVTGRSIEPGEHRMLDLVQDLIAALRSRPYLLVLDGFERMLLAYQRLDPASVHDDQIDATARELIDGVSAAVVRALTTCSPSKVIVSSRLMPSDLEGRNRRPIPGVLHKNLDGLTDPDTLELAHRLGVHGTKSRIEQFFKRLGNHPLLIGVVAGLVRDYRRGPGDFDRWLDDPDAGGGLRLDQLDLKARRKHVLAAALDRLDPSHRELLLWLSILPGSVDYRTIEDVNPLLPERPTPPTSPRRSFLDEWLAKRRGEELPPADEADAEFERQQAAYEQRLAEWEELVKRTGGALLDRGLGDLEERGLLWWDRSTNTYDLHPVVRAYARDQLGDADRVRASSRLRDHFGPLPDESVPMAASIEDLHRYIVVFRALVDSRRYPEAADTYRKIGTALRFGLAAYPTIIELLEKTAPQLDLYAQWELGSAYGFVGRDDECEAITLDNLREGLRRDDRAHIVGAIQGLVLCGLRRGRLAFVARYLELDEPLLRTASDRTLHDLRRAYFDYEIGDYDAVNTILERLRAAPTPDRLPSFADDVTELALDVLLTTGQLSLDRLEEMAVSLTLGRSELALEELRASFYYRDGNLESATEHAEKALRTARRNGVITSGYEARLALILATRGDEHRDAARTLIEQTLTWLDRVPPSRRPSRTIAEVLDVLGEREAAIPHAVAGYIKAWSDGPPFVYQPALDEVQKMLATFGVEPPVLPTVDYATCVVPMEPEIRAWITEHAQELEDYDS